ncbi:MAG: beta-carotene 15,15'-monooxygenase, partial [Bacillota bacterium]
MTEGKSSSLLNIIRYAGAYIALIIGAGFASGQEVMQFFTTFGYLSLGSFAIVIVLFAFFGVVFVNMGHRLNCNTHGPVLRYFCGNHLGTFFEWVTTFFIFGIFAIMISGGGAALTQYYGINPYVGRAIITIASIITVLLGLNALVNAISAIAPVTIIISLIIGLATFINNPGGFANVTAALQTVSVAKAAPNWWLSPFIYVSYNIMCAIPLMVAIGQSAPVIGEARKGAILGGVALGGAAMILNLGMLSIITEVYNKDIPVLYMADKVIPVIGAIFSLVLIGEIYSTAVPLLYTFAARFTKEGTSQFKRMTIGTAIAGFVVGLFPFAKLVGTLYPFFGYIGL